METQIAIFSYVTPYSLLELYICFSGHFFLHH